MFILRPPVKQNRIRKEITPNRTLEFCKIFNSLSYRHNTHVTQTCHSCHIDMLRWLYVVSYLRGLIYLFPFIFTFCRTFIKFAIGSIWAGQRMDQSLFYLLADIEKAADIQTLSAKIFENSGNIWIVKGYSLLMVE